jgi:predicted enzyme related to lactoylglutathione lyase
MGDPVVYFEVLGADGTVLRDFYSGMFGWAIDAVEGTAGGYHRVEGEDGGIQGGIGAFPGAPSQVTFYVRTDDLQAAVARAGELGGRTVMEPRVAAGAIETALIEDPEGHVIGLIRGL